MFWFSFSELSCLFFALNSAVFVGGEQNIFAPDAWYPSNATDKIIGGRGLRIV